MALFRLASQKSNACYIMRLYVDVMMNGTRGVLMHPQLLATLKSESKYKTSEAGGVRHAL
jgi:hypothetical protein